MLRRDKNGVKLLLRRVQNNIIGSDTEVFNHLVIEVDERRVTVNQLHSSLNEIVYSICVM